MSNPKVVQLDGKRNDIIKALDEAKQLILAGKAQSFYMVVTTEEEVRATWFCDEVPYVLVGALEASKADILDKTVE